MTSAIPWVNSHNEWLGIYLYTLKQSHSERHECLETFPIRFQVWANVLYLWGWHKRRNYSSHKTVPFFILRYRPSPTSQNNACWKLSNCSVSYLTVVWTVQRCWTEMLRVILPYFDKILCLNWCLKSCAHNSRGSTDSDKVPKQPSDLPDTSE